jgi:hypothetical protein
MYFNFVYGIGPCLILAGRASRAYPRWVNMKGAPVGKNLEAGLLNIRVTMCDQIHSYNCYESGQA